MKLVEVVGEHLIRDLLADRDSALDGEAVIASIRFVSPHTVRKHLEHAYKKLGVHTRTAAVARVS